MELKVLNYIGEKVVNETRGYKPDFNIPRVPIVEIDREIYGTKQILDQYGPDGLIEWIKKIRKVCY